MTRRRCPAMPASGCVCPRLRVPPAAINIGPNPPTGFHSMISKLRITALLVAVLALLLSAGPAAARSLDEIREAGVLRVGTSLFTPWAIRAGEGQLIGFEADVARKLAADMGVEPELKVYPWKELVDALEAGEIDMIAAGMSVTPARALRVWFSDAYHESGVTLATNTAKTADVARLEDLNDPRYRIGVVKGTVAEDLARRVFGEAKIGRASCRERVCQYV